MSFPKIDLKKRLIVFVIYMGFFEVYLLFELSKLPNGFLDMVVLLFGLMFAGLFGMQFLYYWLKDRNMLDDYVISLLEGN